MKKLVLFWIGFFLLMNGRAQVDSTNREFFNDFNFITHLAKNKLFTEAEAEKRNLFSKPGISPLYIDSVNFFMGMEYFEDHRLLEARQLFLSVSDQVFFYYKARYLAGIIDTEKNRPDSAIINYSNIEESTNNDLNELKQFELSGLYLLKKDYRRFDSISMLANFKNPLISEEFQNLKNYAQIDKKIKRKSPVLAGTMSAIIPGLGKVYAGNNGQALASFLACGFTGAVAVENYLHFGIKHPQTILFTGVFGLFYVGNIWGSALSVQIVKIEKQLENKHNILVGLKLPVSKFFN